MKAGRLLRLLVRGGALLAATAAIAWGATLALAALKPLFGIFLASVPVWQFAGAAWAAVMCLDKFAARPLRPLRPVFVCWAIGLSLAAGAEMGVREWAVSDDALHRFEEGWVEVRASLDWLLRYDLLAALLTTVWMLTWHAEGKHRFLPLSPKAVGYGGRVLMVLTAATTFSFFTEHAAEAVATDSFQSRQTEATTVLRETEDAVGSERARRSVQQRIEHDSDWAATRLRTRIEAMVRAYGPHLCSGEQTTCHPALEHFTLSDAGHLAPDDAAQVRLLLENFEPGQPVRVRVQKDITLPGVFARAPTSCDELRAQQEMLAGISVRRDTAVADDHEAGEDLNHLGRKVGFQVVNSANSLLMTVIGVDATSAIFSDSAAALFEAVAETVMQSRDGSVPDDPVIGIRIRQGATLPIERLAALLRICGRGPVREGIPAGSGDAGERKPLEIIDRAPPRFVR